MIRTEGLARSHVLAALYNNARIRGVHWFDPRAYRVMTPLMARDMLEGLPHFRFETVRGRRMYVDLSDESQFDPTGYDRHNGGGRAERVITQLRQTGSVEWT